MASGAFASGTPENPLDGGAADSEEQRVTSGTILDLRASSTVR